MISEKVLYVICARPFSILLSLEVVADSRLSRHHLLKSIAKTFNVLIIKKSVYNQRLLQSDTQLARSLFNCLFEAVAGKLSNNKDFLESAKSYVHNIFKTSTQFIPNTMATLLDLVLAHIKEVDFHPNVIAMVAQNSELYSVGSLILEEYILSHDMERSTSKKAPGVDSIMATYLLKLAEYV